MIRVGSIWRFHDGALRLTVSVEDSKDYGLFIVTYVYLLPGHWGASLSTMPLNSRDIAEKVEILS